MIRRSSSWAILILLGWSICSTARAAEPVPDVGRELTVVGNKLRETEEKVTETPDQGSVSSEIGEAFIGTIDRGEDLESTGGDDSEKTYTVRNVAFRGDIEWLEKVDAADEIRLVLIGKTLTLETMRERVAEVQKKLVDDGFFLASLWVQEVDELNGAALVQVDAGRVGNLNMRFQEKGRDVPEDLVAKEGRFFTQKQLQARMVRTQTGNVFNYNDFKNDLTNLNSHPDIVIDTELDVRSRIENDVLKRTIDLDMVVTEQRPLHFVGSINNFGTETTENWQVEATVQHLNLTKHNDVLTLSGSSSIDFGSLYAGAASYSLPYYAASGGRITGYGGYSLLDAREVVESVDLKGEGWFAGLQWSHNIVNSRDLLLTGSLGFVRRYVEDQLVVGGFETEPRGATIMPYSVALSFTQFKPDFLDGRNFATLQFLYNAGDVLGTSDDVEINTLRPGAEADYFITKLQLARVQPLFGRVKDDGSTDGKWVFFARGEAQFSSGPVIPAEQIGVGGNRSVRGYQEFEFFGDDGGYLNLELRTPLLINFFSNQFGSNANDQLQFLGFVDAGYTRIQDPLPSIESEETISSAGLGFRLSLYETAQLRFDWGFPLVETPESDSTGTGHVELQIQF